MLLENIGGLSIRLSKNFVENYSLNDQKKIYDSTIVFVQKFERYQLLYM